MNSKKILIKNIGELVTVSNSFKDESGLGIIKNGAIYIKDEKIIWVGRYNETPEEFLDLKEAVVIDAANDVVMPGLIDPHTHLIFAGSRENEFEMRIKGRSYLEILEMEGGIYFTVEATRKASFEELFRLGERRLNRMLAKGITTIEGKSGYGLNIQNELKILSVIKALNEVYPIDIISTFLGAHTIPKEFKNDRGKYVDLLINEMIPKVAQERLAEFCDVFCEEKAFSIEESRMILETGKRFGLKPKIHADQLTHGGGAELAAEVGAFSADHLEYISERGMEMLAEKGVVAIVLPGANFFLSMNKFPPVREMIKRGILVALATDLNPGSSMTESLPMMMTMGCIMFKMTPEEVIKAVTINAAKSIDRDKEIGSIEIGKKADLVILDIPNYKYLPYHFGVDHVKKVIKNGKIVFNLEDKDFGKKYEAN